MCHKTLIITGGSVDTDAASFSEKWDAVIAVDGGTEAAARLKILPTHMIGDFDTADSALIAELKKKGVQSITLNPHKDQTDTQEAVDWALRMGAEEIWMLGAIGTRMDHTLANLGLLEVIRRAGKKGYIVNAHNKIYLADRSIQLKRDCVYGTYVSLLPFTPRVTGVTLRGFAYPLENQTFTAGICPGWGVSNEITEETAEIIIESGVLLVLETRD